MEDNASIISAIITAGASVITTLLGVWLRKIISNSSLPRSIRERQLIKLYMPLEICLHHSQELGQSTILDEAYKIMVDNIVLVPTQILNELESAQKDISRIYHFKLVVSSYYNWTKKSLGYPFDGDAILPDYTPVSQKREKACTIAVIVALSFWVISACIIIEHILFPRELKHPTIFSVFCIIFCVGLGLYIQWLLSGKK